MKRRLLLGNIASISADTLVYSTNVQLMLSGGVGASLLRQYGPSFQEELYRCIDSSGRKLAEVGEIFTTSPVQCPWKIVFHAVATDPLYNTDPVVVQAILTRCFESCAHTREIRSIVLSPLGTGYGDLPLERFLDLVSTVSVAPHYESIKEITVCCDHPPFFDVLVSHSPNTGVEWYIEGEQSGEGKVAALHASP